MSVSPCVNIELPEAGFICTQPPSLILDFGGLKNKVPFSVGVER